MAKMVETPNNARINIYPQLDTAIQFKIDEINKPSECLITDIRENETMSKVLTKSISAFE